MKKKFLLGSALIIGGAVVGAGTGSTDVFADETTYTINSSYSVDESTTDRLTDTPASGSVSVTYNKKSVSKDGVTTLLATGGNNSTTGTNVEEHTVDSSTATAADTEQRSEQSTTPETPAKTEQVHPMGDAPNSISSYFGEVRSMILSNGQYYSDVHNGVDYVGADGTPIHAYRAGEVVFAGVYSDGATAVIIKHDNGLYSYSWHLQAGSTTVQTGQRVEAGDVIGRQGSTGMVTGSHLHFGLSTGWWSGYVNPQDYL